MTMTRKTVMYALAFALVGSMLTLINSCKKDNETKIPSLTTAEVIEIAQTTATSGGSITDDGGATITARGVCWSTNQNPTISDSKTIDGTGTGSFTSAMTGLEPATTYYVRAYATNIAGIGYGDALSFTTVEAVGLPTVTTKEITEVTQTSALSGGHVTDDGGAPVIARGVCWSTNQNPTVSDSKTEDGSGLGSFTSSLSGLEPSTMYYVRAYATNSEGTGYGDALSFTTLEEITGVVDADGNVYTTVTIGSQVWLGENLRTTKYSDGTPIPSVSNNTDWSNLSTPGYAVYPHANIDGLDSDEEVLNAYGALYNGFAVETGNLCPTGWHVPTDAEWSTLTEYAGGASVAGGKLKSIRTSPEDHPRWVNPNTGATDEYGFTAVPGGNRVNFDGSFYNVGNYGNWWTSTVEGTTLWVYYMGYYDAAVGRANDPKKHGYSVRCIMD